MTISQTHSFGYPGLRHNETVAKLVTRSNFEDMHLNGIAKCLILEPSSRRNFKFLHMFLLT